MARGGEEVVVEMASGCLCCTIRGDLARTLREAPGRFARGGKPWFDRVLIETAGLADPAPILHTVMGDPLLQRGYALAGVITTVDAVNGTGTPDRHPEAVKQAAVADRLVLTETDISDDATARTLQQRLRALNPGAPIDAIVDGALTPDAVLDDWPSAERRSRIVFITRDIPQSSIEEMLTAFTGVRGDAPGWRGARGGRHTHDHEGEGPQ